MSISILEYNGERVDLFNRTIHSGNGYRSYNMRLMRFHCPDAMSPIGQGGINSYAYCGGEPVNWVDPSGHHSVWGWLGIGMGVALGALLTPVSGGSSLAVALSVLSVVTLTVSTGLAVAQQFTEENDPTTATALGWAALGTGIVSGLSSAGLSWSMPGAKSLISLFRGTSSRPLGGLMMQGTAQARISSRTARLLRFHGVFRQRGSRSIESAIISEHYPRGLFRSLCRYEDEAHEVASEWLRLPPRREDNVNTYRPEFGEHRRLIMSTPYFPIYSRELRQLAPLPEYIERNLNRLYDLAGVTEAAREYAGTNHLSGIDIRLLPPPPPEYSEVDPMPVPQYASSEQDKVIDYHYMTHL